MPSEEFYSTSLQKVFDATNTFNPSLELSYWSFGLETAQKWRERLNMERVEKWDSVLQNLSKLPEVIAKRTGEKVYLNTESASDFWENLDRRTQHLSFAWAMGPLPGKMVDQKIMLNSLKEALVSWNFRQIWDTDMPLCAMTATRLHQPSRGCGDDEMPPAGCLRLSHTRCQ